MGCGFVAIVPADRAGDAAELLAARHPGRAASATSPTARAP